MAQGERVGGQGDQGLGGLRLDPGTKPEDLLLHFWGVAFLTSPSLCFIRGHTCRALQGSGSGGAGPAQGRLGLKGDHSPLSLAIGLVASISSDLSLFIGLEDCHALTLLESPCMDMSECNYPTDAIAGL